MPKISDIQETPNPNAVKFILREAVSNGIANRSALHRKLRMTHLPGLYLK
jgi:hypothetical protein